MTDTAELIAMLLDGIGSEFDDELHLSGSEARQIAAALSSQNLHNEIISNLIEWHDEKAVTAAIARGDIEEAKRIAFLHAPTEPPVSTDPKKKNATIPPPSLVHLRARAHFYLAVKDYDKALADAEEVLSQERATAGGMSLRTQSLTEAEELVARIQSLRQPPPQQQE